MHKALSRVLFAFSPDECEFRLGVPLSRLTTFRIGGACLALALPRTETALGRLLSLLYSEGIPRTVIGNGSNLLAPDGGYSGIVISTRLLNKFSLCEHTIEAGAGASLSSVCRAASRAGLADFASLTGIPATVGGALYMNAGAFDVAIGDLVRSVRVLPFCGGEPFELLRDECHFGYRESIFDRRGLIVLGATLSGAFTSVEEAIEKERATLEHRCITQPLSLPSAGSVFRRPPGDYAGRLIEAAGMKGLTVGGAQISPRHAGFIVNTGDATASDVLSLIAIARETVRERFGVTLELEIEYLGE